MFIQPAIFLVSVLVIYLLTGVGALLFIIGAVLFIIFTVIGLLILVRRSSVTCFHLGEGAAVIERSWPWEPVHMALNDVSLRHLGAKLYRIERGTESYVFDKSLCTCMTDAAWQDLLAEVGGSPELS
jgi:hypothetical protein